MPRQTADGLYKLASATPAAIWTFGSVTFGVNWIDGGGDRDRAVICRAAGVDPQGSCIGGTYATGPLSATSPSGHGQRAWLVPRDRKRVVISQGARATMASTP